MTGKADDEHSAFDRRLDAILTGPFVGFAGILTDRCDPAAATLPEMVRSGALARALDQVASHHPGAETGAVASLWSRHYFAVLLGPGLAAGVGLGRVIPLGIEGVRLRLHPGTGLPIGLCGIAGEGDTMPLPTQLDRLLAEAVAPAIRLLRDATGLSPRLLWENAGGHLFWTLRFLAEARPACTGSLHGALKALSWPREACAALALMRTDAVAGIDPPRRRVCCLADRLPGCGRCIGICPLKRRS